MTPSEPCNGMHDEPMSNPVDNAIGRIQCSLPASESDASGFEKDVTILFGEYQRIERELAEARQQDNNRVGHALKLSAALEKARDEYLNECCSHEETRQERDSLRQQLDEAKQGGYCSKCGNLNDGLNHVCKQRPVDAVSAMVGFDCTDFPMQAVQETMSKWKQKLESDNNDLRTQIETLREALLMVGKMHVMLDDNFATMPVREWQKFKVQRNEAINSTQTK